MKIEEGRSDWLKAVDHVWVKVEGGESAPCRYNPERKRTWLRFRLALRQPFRVDADGVYVARTEGVDRMNAQVAPDDECLPGYLRTALSDDLFDEVFLMGSRSDLVTSVIIHVEARGKLGDISRFRDFVVRKLLKKTK